MPALCGREREGMMFWVDDVYKRLVSYFVDNMLVQRVIGSIRDETPRESRCLASRLR